MKQRDIDSKMDDYTKISTIDVQSWDDFYEHGIKGSLVTTGTKLTAVDNIESHTNLARKMAFESYRSFAKLIPNIEVVVVDPDSFYSSESEDSSDCESDIDIHIENDFHQPEPVHCQKLEVQTCEGRLLLKTSPLKELVSHVRSGELVDVLEQPVELIDGLFDFVALSAEDEDVLLQEMTSLDNYDKNFDLAAYITDQSESPNNSPEPASTNAIRSHEPNTISGSSRCKNLKRQFLGDDDSGDSDNDCKVLKKRKVDNDPLWKPSEKPTITAKNNKKVQLNKGSVGHGIRRGKDIATLSKYFKNPTSSEKPNCDKLNKSVKQYACSVNKTKEQINKKKKVHKVTKKSKDSEINNNATDLSSDLSDFEKAILASMGAPKIDRRPKRINSAVPTRKIQFQEHSEKFRQYLSDKAAKSKILKENNRRTPVMVDSAFKPGTTNNVQRKKLPEQQRKMDTENCEPSKKDVEPTRTSEPSIQRKDTWQSTTTDLNIDSNVKRKITVEEYFKRKATELPA